MALLVCVQTALVFKRIVKPTNVARLTYLDTVDAASRNPDLCATVSDFFLPSTWLPLTNTELRYPTGWYANPNLFSDVFRDSSIHIYWKERAPHCNHDSFVFFSVRWDIPQLRQQCTHLASSKTNFVRSLSPNLEHSGFSYLCPASILSNFHGN